LEKQVGGPLYLGYGLRSLEKLPRRLRGWAGDANALVNISKRRFENEIGFYCDFEIDPN